MTGCGLAIFVKTPALSPVKSRLWPSIGKDRAVALFGLCAQATRSVVARAAARSSLHAYWAVAETAALHEPIWSSMPTLAQGEGGLGKRMSSVYDALRRDHRGAILIGADSPQLAVSALQEAIAWLDCDEPRMVIGPAADGGFWLFGANVALPEAAWLEPEYSSATTAETFRSAMSDRGEWLTLATLRDLDRPDDIAAVANALDELPEATVQQSSLRRFLQQLHVAVAETT